MFSLRAITLALSAIAHASAIYAVWPHAAHRAAVVAMETGTGTDAINVEQGIAIEGMAALGDAQQTVETAELQPVAQPPPPDLKPVDDFKDVVKSTDSMTEDTVVKAEEPPPIVEEQKLQQIAVSEQSSGEAKTSGTAAAFGLYLGKINEKVQKAAINPRSRAAGTVIVAYSIGVDGSLLSHQVTQSSGHKVLDDAVVAALERAAPFPPIPPEASTKPIWNSQRFKFTISN